MERQTDQRTHQEQGVESWPSIYGELQLSTEYADPNRFTDDQIIDRLSHYEEVEHAGELTSRAMGEVALIRSRLWFEFDQRERERRAREH